MASYLPPLDASEDPFSVDLPLPIEFNPPPSQWRWTTKILLLAAAYYAFAKLGLLLALPPGFATPIWPPSGLALAAVLVLGPRMWPGVLLGSVLANLPTAFDADSATTVARSLLVPLGIGVGATLQAVWGARLIHELVGYPNSLDEPKSIVRFLALAGPVACVVSPSVATTMLSVGGLISYNDVQYNWWTWWAGDVIGAIIVTPIVLCFIGEPRETWRSRRLSVALPLTITLLIVISVFVWTTYWRGVATSQELQLRTQQIVLAAGLLFTGLLGALFLLTTGQSARVKELVVRRTAQLESAIRELRDSEARLQESETRFRHLVEYSQGLICTHDLDGKILSVNPAAALSLGYDPEEAEGRNLREFLPPSVRSAFDVYLARVTKNRADEGLMMITTKEGGERIWQYRNTLYEAGAGSPYVIGHAQDVTELTQAQDELRRLSLTDELTGLHNRRGFFTLAEQALKMARRAKYECLMIYADVDGLKKVNDSLGHAAGSDLLVDIAALLKGVFRESDIIARLGGDEFAILVVDSPASKADVVLGRLQAQLDVFNLTSGRSYPMSLSAGVAASTPERGLSVKDLLQMADEAMYAQKHRNRPAVES